MKLTHVHPGLERAEPTAVPAKRERGFVMVMFGLLLVPLLLMVGLAVDVGSWYNRASDIQKAADAASLAGVVWLPSIDDARTAAKDTAEKNGFKHGVDGITISVERSNKAARRLEVTIRDERVGSFFYGSVGGQTLKISRTSYAEYALPVPLGSPENFFGGNSHSDPDSGADKQPNLWGNIHGPRTNNFKGDLYAAACRNDELCTSVQNPEYRPKGYLYVIDVPAGVEDLDMQVFDAGMYHRSNETIETGDRKYSGDANQTTTATWTFYDKDNTELDVDDNKPVTETGFCSSGSGTWSLADGAEPSTYKNKWVSICAKTGTVPEGLYLLRVQTSGNGASANRYALRVNASTAVKPRIYAHQDMSMYNNVAAGDASFYLAEVDEVHAGKTLKLQLYDPGEVTKTSTTTGNGFISVVTPAGSVAATCSATADFGKTIAPTLTPCKFQSAVGGSAKFDGSEVTLQVPIPPNYTCTAGALPGCWWKIKYEIDGQGNDTTTWSAAVIGDPIHLVEEN